MVDTYDGIERLETEWDALADRVGAAPWLRPGWFRAWWAAFGSGTQTIYTRRRGGRLAAVLPLAARGPVLGSPTNWHTPEFELLGEEGEHAALARNVLETRPAWLSLAFLDGDSVSSAAWREVACALRYRLIERVLERSPFVATDGDWSAYEAGLGRKVLSEIRRRRRRLESEGRFTFEVADGGERLDELLAEGFRIEAAGWKSAQGTAILSSSSTYAFYRDVARWAAQRGWLRLAFLRLDGRAFAFDYCLEDAGVHYLLKTGFDPAYARFSPGMNLRYHMIERAFSTSLKSYEFLGADEPWKLEWTRAVRERLLLQAFPRSPAGLVGWCAFAYGRPAVKRALALAR